VHLVDERLDARTERAGERVGGVGAGGQHERVQQVLDGQRVAGAQVGDGGAAPGGVADVGAGDGDLVGGVGLLEDHVRGHHLGEAGHRPAQVGVLAEVDLAGGGVDQVGGLGQDLGRVGGVGGGGLDDARRRGGVGGGGSGGRDAAGEGEGEQGTAQPVGDMHVGFCSLLPCRLPG